MRQQMPGRQPRSDFSIAHPKIRYVSASRLVESQLAHLCETDDRGSCVRLRDRSDLEQSVVVHRKRMARVSDAEARGKLVSFGEQAERDAWHMVPLHRFGNRFARRFEERFRIH